MERRDFLRSIGGAAVVGSALAGQIRPAHAQEDEADAGDGGFRIGCWASVYNRYSESPELTGDRIKRLADGGISLMVPLVGISGGRRGVMFRSSLVPTCAKYPEDWDALAVLLEAAHGHGIEVHAYLKCFNGKPAEYLREEHPETVAIFSEAEQWPWEARHKGSYCCAMQSRVQDFIIDVYRDLGEHYDVDGFHMDYIRTGSQCTCDYCAEAMAEQGIDIRAIQEKYDTDRERWLETGIHHLLRKYGLRAWMDWNGKRREVEPVRADEGLQEWIDWRCDRLAEFVGRLHEHARDGGRVTSAAVKNFWPAQTPTGAQDWVRWAREGLVDDFMVMMYYDDASVFSSLLQYHQGLLAGTDVQYWPGPGRHEEQWNTTPEGLIEQVRIAKEAGTAGVCIFNEQQLTDDDLKLLAGV
jgi:uncharacterized lipoprotein YddW (UPF0748 family)